MRTNLLLALAMLIITFSACRQNESSDSYNYDCEIIRTQYDANGEELVWWKHYFLDGIVIKVTNSDGGYSIYDNYGNLIERTLLNYKVIYEYDSEHKLLEERYYDGSLLDYYYSYQYSDTLLQFYYKIKDDGDTINCWKHYYGDDHILDSIISNSEKEYYYFSENIDSTITYSQSGDIIQREVNGYENNKEVYSEVALYQPDLILTYRTIVTRDYNEAGLLEVYTYDYTSQYTEVYEKHLYTYNNNLEIDQVNTYDHLNNLLNYSVYSYFNNVLGEIRNYTPDGELNYYWIYDNTCGIAYKNDLLKDIKYPTFVHDNQKIEKYEIIP
jgi:hypothetical protein